MTAYTNTFYAFDPSDMFTQSGEEVVYTVEEEGSLLEAVGYEAG